MSQKLKKQSLCSYLKHCLNKEIFLFNPYSFTLTISTNFKSRLHSDIGLRILKHLSVVFNTKNRKSL